MKLNERGYTLVELLIAMTVFSFMLLIVASVFLQIIRIQQSGIASRDVQQNNRLILGRIVTTARQSNSVTLFDDGGGNQHACFVTTNGIVEYGRDSNGDIHFVASVCSAISPGSGQILNTSTVAVPQLSFSQLAATPGSVSLGEVQITLSTAARNSLSLVNAAHDGCIKSTGSQFCAVSKTTTTAALRTGDLNE